MIKTIILRFLFVGLLCVVQCNTSLQKVRADVVIIKELPGISWTGVAVNTLTNEVYLANYNNRSVDVLDGTSNIVQSTIALTNPPLTLAVDSSRNRIYATDEGRNVVVIDGATKRQLTLVMVGRNPNGIAVNSATNSVYVANRSENSLSVIDGASNTVVATVAVGQGPTSVAVNSATNTIYVMSSAGLSVIDGTNNTVTTRLPGGLDTPGSIAVNPRTNRIYVSNLGVLGSLTVLDGVDNTIIQTLRLGTDTLRLTVNENTGFIYASGSGAGSRSAFILRDDPNFDQARPTVTITSPTNGARLTSLPSVTGTALDNRGGSGLSRVALFLKRSSDGKYWTGKNWSTTQFELETTLGTFNTTGQAFTNADPLPTGANLKQDTYFLTAVAIDRANAFGNRAVTTVSFRVIDVLDPQIAITYPTDGALLNQLTKISGTLTDNEGGSGPARVLLQIRRSSDRKYFDGTMWTATPVTLSTELIGSGEAVAWQRIGGLPPVISGRDVYTITAIGYDRAFNRDDATVTITVGTAATAT